MALIEIDGGPGYFSQFANSLPTDPSYFPIGVWFESVTSQADINLDKAAGLNLYVVLTGNSNLSLIQNNGMYAILQQSEWRTNQAAINNPAVVGWELWDEIDMQQGPGQGYTTLNNILATLPADGRFHYNNYGKGVMFWETDSQAEQFVNDFQQVTSADTYWFTDPNIDGGSEGGALLNNGNPLTVAQTRLAANYGYTVDRMRELDGMDGVHQPIWAFVEVGWPFTETAAQGARAIQPEEIKAAVWHSLIAGARGIIYFNHSFGGPDPTQHALRDPDYAAQRAAVTETNALIEQLAPVLNAPFDDAFVTVSPTVRVMAKFYDGWHYVFAGSTQHAASTATFTLPSVTSGTATVINEGRTIAITGGQFSDYFADGNAIHIYQINTGGTPTPGVATIGSFATDSGVVGDGITNDNTLTLTGTAAANSTVTVFDGTTQIGTATANGSGAWSFTTGTLPNGSHSFTATATSGGTTSPASAPLSVTVDTVAPSPPTIASFATDTGTVGDGITSDNTLTLTGTAAANSTVRVYDGATVLGTVVASGSGAWSYTTGTLSNATHSFTATAMDAAGNVSAASAALSVTVTTPGLSAPTIASFSTDSNVVGDGITNDNTLTLTGTAPANSTVTVFDATSQLGTTTANGSGAWSFTTGTLPNGSHSFTATATSGGTTSPASAPLSVTVDTVAPSPPTIASFATDTGTVGDGITSDNTLTLTGTVAANSTVRVYDGATLLGTVAASGSGAWSYATGTLSNATHSFTATAMDAAGNISAASAALSVTVSASVSQDLVVNGGFESGNFSGWTLSGNFSGNQIYIAPTVFPGEVHTGSYSAGFGSFNTDGILTQNIATTAGQHYTLSFWIASDNNQFTPINHFAAKWNGQTLLDVTNVPNTGYQLYTFDVVGINGNSVLAFYGYNHPDAWRLDDVVLTGVGVAVPTAPTIASFSTDSNVVGDGITNDNTLILIGTAAANSTVTVFDGSTQLGTTTANGSGAWSFTTGTSSNGNHSFTATATSGDTTSSPSSPLPVTVDTVAPSAPTIAAFSTDSNVVGDGITNDNTLTLTGAAAANSTVTVFDGTTQIGTATANGSGAWSFATGTLSNATHSFTARATDAAGNTGAASAVFAVTIDATVITGDNNANTLTGTSGNNTIVGLRGNDTVNGGAGSDTLIGGAGADTLTGGTGNDTFVYGAIGHSGPAAAARDTITDFVHLSDKIDLSAIDANIVGRPATGDQAFAFIAGQNSQVVANSVTWFTVASSNLTIIQADVNGDATADLAITLTGIKSLTAEDFVL